MLTAIEVLTNHVERFLGAYDPFSGDLPRSRLRVYVPHIGGRPYAAVIAACKLLRSAGMRVVPHVAVRNLTAADGFMEDVFATFQKQGIDELLLLGGDAKEAERYDSVSAFLRIERPDRYGVKKAFVATFADGHPVLDDHVAIQALETKIAQVRERGMEAHLISQIAFSHQPLLAHCEKVAPLECPVSVGFVAPCQPHRLIQIAALSGVQKSLDFLRKKNLLKSLLRFDSDSLIKPLLKSRAIDGLHCFPFGNYTGGLQNLKNYQQMAAGFF